VEDGRLGWGGEREGLWGVRVVVKVSCGIEKSSLGPWKLSSSLYLSSIENRDFKTLPAMFSLLISRLFETVFCFK